MTRDELVDLAHECGFGLVYEGIPNEDDPTRTEKWSKEIWGGSCETAKLVRFAQALEQRLAQQKLDPYRHGYWEGNKP